MSTPPSKLRSWLERYAFALACAVALLIAVILLLAGRHPSGGAIVSSLGLSLLGSVVFALIFTTLSVRVQQRNLLDRLQDEFRELATDMQNRIQQSNSQHLPARNYEASSNYQDEFNRDVSDCLRRTNLYAFKGTSAKYVPARIRLSSQLPQQVRVALPDPSIDAVVRRRAADRALQNGTGQVDVPQQADIAQAMADVRTEIYMSLVALFDVRNSCSVEIALGQEEAVIRLELFDDAAFISWYQGPTSTMHRFPQTFRFQSGSFCYETERLQIIRKFEVGTKVHKFDGGQDDSYIKGMLGELRGAPISDAELAELRQRYEEFIAPFEELIRRMN